MIPSAVSNHFQAACGDFQLLRFSTCLKSGTCLVDELKCAGETPNSRKLETFGGLSVVSRELSQRNDIFGLMEPN